jgi:hypothetical protein
MAKIDHGRIDVALSEVHAQAGAAAPASNGANVLDGLDLKLGTRAIGELVAARELAFARVYDQLDGLKNDLVEFFPQVPEVLPASVEGQLLNPNGQPAAGVSVEAERPSYPSPNGKAAKNGAPDVAWTTPRTITDARGAFSLALPTVPIPADGLQLSVKGADAATTVVARAADLAVGGRLGVIPLDRQIGPLQTSVLAQLHDELDIAPTSAADAAASPSDFATPAPGMTLGEGDCARSFRSNAGVIDQFAYSLLVRLVAPEVTPKTLISVRRHEGREFPMPILEPKATIAREIPAQALVEYFQNFGTWQFVDRVPVSAPIDVSGFLAAAGEHPWSVPRAASLGLGYVLKMHQTWIPAGLSLGDLVYSLPLAPGEQQRVAVYEKRETLSVIESESLSIDEAQSFAESEDSSTSAIFDSAYREAASGGSTMTADSTTRSQGGGAAFSFFGLFSAGASGGYGSSHQSGSASNWQQGSKDYASSAAQSFHSSLGRHSAAARRSSRTGMRLATATDSEQVTTTVITNHNHGHALTMQWWEVLRHFSVASEIDDVQLVCFVPLELVDFLPSGQPRTLPKAGYVYSRDNLLARYAVALRHLDVLAYETRYRPDYQYGLRLLREFAANPTIEPQDPSTGTAEDEIAFSVTGTFLPIEDVSATLVSKSGVRVGPVRLQPPAGTEPFEDGKEETAEKVVDSLLARRKDLSGGVAYSATFSLPEYIARDDIARFEVTRAFRPLTYKLKEPSFSLTNLNELIQWLEHSTASFSASQLEQQIGGPLVWDVKATITPSGPDVAIAYSGNANAVHMGGTLPVGALRVAPVLGFSDLLRIEAVFQHLVSNTTRYSKAVWMSLTPEERAIMLEHYTIGVPTGGLADASQEVPLLNCVANEVLGYFGNSAVMPFFIPEQVAGELQMTTRDVQEAIYKFHKQAFVAPRSSITLPARGMLGEAVLGDCDSCEKIDLTRFWNWQDSPADTAAEPSPAGFGTSSLAGVTGPSALTSQPVNQNLLTIGNSGPAPTSDALSALIAKAPDLTAFGDLTGLTALQKSLDTAAKGSGDAEKTAISTGASMANQLVTSTADVLKAALGGTADKKAADADAKKKDDPAAAQQKQQQQKAGTDKLKSNLDSYIKVAGSQTDQGAADKWAQALLSDLFGDVGIGLGDAASFFGLLQPSGGDDDATKMGKAALLAALGL